MGKKWMPITAGVLDIIGGVFGILLGLLILALGSGGWLWGGAYEVYQVWGPLHILVGVLAIAGSIFAFKRKKWYLALVGAVAALVSTILYMIDFWQSFSPRHFFSLPTLLGFIGIPAIIAIILTVLSRKQFERK